jgi:hypothetical protein
MIAAGIPTKAPRQNAASSMKRPDDPHHYTPQSAGKKPSFPHCQFASTGIIFCTASPVFLSAGNPPPGISNPSPEKHLFLSVQKNLHPYNLLKQQHKKTYPLSIPAVSVKNFVLRHLSTPATNPSKKPVNGARKNKK